MTLYRIPISYKPKDEPIWTGECCQTIRPDHGVQLGDELLIYAWSGVPYRSKWKWQLHKKVISAYPIIVYKEGIAFEDMDDGDYYPWNSKKINNIARLDGIEPATGEALREVLFKFIGVPGPDGIRCQIIRW